MDLDELGIQGQFKEEVERYHKFNKSVLGIKNKNFKKQKDIDIRNYAKYLLKEGSILEKRELLVNLKSKLVVKNRKVYLTN